MPYIFSTLVILGFPKNLENQIDYIIYKSSESAICEIDNIFILKKNLILIIAQIIKTLKTKKIMECMKID